MILKLEHFILPKQEVIASYAVMIDEQIKEIKEKDFNKYEIVNNIKSVIPSVKVK